MIDHVKTLRQVSEAQNVQEILDAHEEDLHPAWIGKDRLSGLIFHVLRPAIRVVLEENERLLAEVTSRRSQQNALEDCATISSSERDGALARIDVALARIQEWRVAPVGSEPTLDVLLDGIAKALRGEL